MRLLRKLFRLTLWIFAALVLIFLILWGLLQFPVVQNAVVHQITNYLSEELNTKAEIKRVDLRFFKTAVLEGVYIEDLEQDTLLYAEELAVNLRLFSLLRKKLFVEKIELTGAQVNLVKRVGAEEFNFQFIVDAFSSDNPKPQQDESAPWNIELDKVELKDVYFAMIDQNNGSETIIASQDLFINVDQLNLQDQIINISKARFNGVKVDLVLPKASEEETVTPKEEDDILKFPTIPWQVIGKNINAASSHFSLRMLDGTEKGEGINFSNFSLENVNFQIEDYQWIGKQMSGNLKDLAFKESSGFELKKLDLSFAADSSGIQVSNLFLQTPNTTLANQTTLVYDQFNNLKDFLHKVSIEADFKNTSVAVKDIQFFAPIIKRISGINFPPGAGLLIAGKLSGTVNNLSADSLHVQLGELLDLKVHGTLAHLADEAPLEFDLEVIRLATSYENFSLLTDSLNLPEGLASLGTIELALKVKGPLNDLNIGYANINTETNTRFSGRGLIVGLPKMDNLVVLAGISDLSTNAEDLKNLIGESVPTILDSLGQINYVGNFIANRQQYSLDGAFETSLGRIENDVRIEFTPDYHSGDYAGTVNVIDFDLGKLLNDGGDFGRTSFVVSGSGEGFNLDELTANAQLEIANLEFKNYNYREVILDGDLKRGFLEAVLRANDPNLDFFLEGQMDILAATPEYKGELILKRLDFKALQLSEEPLVLKTKGKFDMKGTQLDELDGQVNLTNLALTDGKRMFQDPNIELKLDQENESQKRIQLNSRLLNAEMNGIFTISQLQASVANFLNEYYYLKPVPDSAYASTQNFTFKLKVNEPKSLVLDLIPTITNLESAQLQGTYDDQKGNLQVSGSITGIALEGIEADSVDIKINNTTQKITSTILVKPLNLGVTEYPKVRLNSILQNDSINLDLRGIGLNEEEKLGTRLTMFPYQEGIAFHFDPDFIFNDSIWRIPATNWIYYGNNYLFVKDFKIQQKVHSISVQSKDPFNSSDETVIDIKFKDYEVEEFTNFLNLEQDLFSGALNGDIELVDLFGDFFYTGNLYIDDLALKEEPLGELSLSARQYTDRPAVNIGVGLLGDKAQFMVNGDYAFKEDNVDLFASITKLDLSLLNPFLEGNVSKAKGLVSGQAELKGSLSDPKLTSTVNLERVGLMVDYLKTQLNIPQHTLSITEKAIDFGTMSILGIEDQKAKLSGNINHQFFSDLTLDLRFETDKFRLLNTTIKENPLFWGTLNLDTDVTARGAIATPILTINARTLPNSTFYLQPLYEEFALTTDDYIIFGNPQVLRLEDPEWMKQQYRVKNTFGMDLLMNLDVTPDLELQLIVDPETGDKVVCKGSSTMSIGMSPAGEMVILGDYVLESGQYTFSYGNLLRKKFDIEQGSYIGFTGNPMEAILDITAIYESRTSTYGLIGNEVTLSEEEERASKKRSLVKTKLIMEGTLLEPEISFDIEVEQDAVADALGSTVERKLDELRNDPDQMNQQVFSLLLFNNFLPADNSSAGNVWQGAGERVAFNSVSKLITNQLNNLANRYIKGVEVSIDFESYQSDYASSNGNNVVTEVGVGLSKQLFNERVTISAEADVGLESAYSESFSSIAGDFVLEYKLTKNGNYLLRVFRQNDFDALRNEETNKTGIGISWKKEFGKAGKGKK